MKKKILVVDDEITVCDLLKRVMITAGCEVITATSALEGLEKLKTERPVLVLLDINMPGMNGVEAISRIREIDEDVVIIMATAVMDEKTAEKAIEAGASDYIVKPFDINYLKKSLLTKISMLP